MVLPWSQFSFRAFAFFFAKESVTALQWEQQTDAPRYHMREVKLFASGLPCKLRAIYQYSSCFSFLVCLCLFNLICENKFSHNDLLRGIETKPARTNYQYVWLKSLGQQMRSKQRIFVMLCYVVNSPIKLLMAAICLLVICYRLQYPDPHAHFALVSEPACYSDPGG